MKAKIAVRLPMEFSLTEWTAIDFHETLRRDHFVEVQGSFYVPLERSDCWLYPFDLSGHDLIGAYATLVSDYTRKPLRHYCARVPTEDAEWCAEKARDEAFERLRSSLTMEAVQERRKQSAADHKEVAAELRRNAKLTVSAPRLLRSGLEFDSKRQRTPNGSHVDAESTPPPPAGVPTLAPPSDPLKLQGMFVVCQFRMDRPSRWVTFAGKVVEVNLATQEFTVSFVHEAFLKLSDTSRTFALSELNTPSVCLVSRKHSVEQWLARAKALDADHSFRKEKCFSRGSDPVVVNKPDSILQATIAWLHPPAMAEPTLRRPKLTSQLRQDGCEGDCVADDCALPMETKTDRCDVDYVLSVEEMNLVEEEDLEDDLAILAEVNAFNFDTLQCALRKRPKAVR